jgi:asparagine synthase (glutamine-hydrolysing)
VCGICGIVRTDGRAVDRDLLGAMSATLRHRGPDSGGEVIDREAGLAARRLAIIDLEGGDQPIAGVDGRVVVVQNGEIYNHAELRAELEHAGHVFRTPHSDTEVLVHLYEEHGPRFAERLRGMFAVAVWDGERRRLVLARDRFGIKPLYYRDGPGDFAFASELKALRRLPGLARDIDLDALESFLAFNAIHGPRTIFREVRKLPPGHVLVLEDGRTRLERYAFDRPAAVSSLRDEPWEALAAELRERLRDSVRAHLVADVPVGVLLSGGIDSSALAALAATESAARVSTFSIGFAERSFSEVELARTIAERYGTDHHELVVEPDAAELLPAIAAAFDEPFADSSALPTYLVSELAAQHVKVALSGEGGDELFGGYETYVADQLALYGGGAARLLSPLAERLPSGSGRVPLDYKLKRFTRAAHLPPLERHHGWKEIFSPDARAALLRPERRGSEDPLDVYRARWAETEGADTLARLQDVDRAIYLVDDLLVKTDRMSMAHSLELRVPFLDPAVAELALALPVAARVRGFAKKRLLRSAVEPLIGRQIARGRKKGFSIPAAAWLRGELEPFCREVLSAERLRGQGYFDPAAVSRLIDEHVARREDHSRQLWGLMSFSLWQDGLAADASGAPPALAHARG